MYTFKCGIVNKLWKQSPVYLNHVCLWRLFFDPHHTTYQSNKGIPLRKVGAYHPHILEFANITSIFKQPKLVDNYIQDALSAMLG